MDVSLYQQIESLPEELQKKLKEYVAQLRKNKNSNKKGVVFGLAKGMIEMNPDFDDPIPGMEEYLP